MLPVHGHNCIINFTFSFWFSTYLLCAVLAQILRLLSSYHRVHKDIAKIKGKLKAMIAAPLKHATLWYFSLDNKDMVHT
jgi:hypothetical protein